MGTIWACVLLLEQGNYIWHTSWWLQSHALHKHILVLGGLMKLMCVCVCVWNWAGSSRTWTKLKSLSQKVAGVIVVKAQLVLRRQICRFLWTCTKYGTESHIVWKGQHYSYLGMLNIQGSLLMNHSHITSLLAINHSDIINMSSPQLKYNNASYLHLTYDKYLRLKILCLIRVVTTQNMILFPSRL